MPVFDIDVELPTGTKTGAGPIATASSWRNIRRLSKAGEVAFTMPAADPQAAELKAKRIVRCHSLRGVTGSRARTEFGAGIVDSIAVDVDLHGGSKLNVSGNDLLDELTTRSVGNLAAFVTTAVVATHVAKIADLTTYNNLTSAHDGDVTTRESVTLSADDHLFIGAAAPFAAARVDVSSTVNTTAATLTARYWNGSAWTSLTITDGTRAASKTLSQDGDITFTTPGAWATTTVNGVTAYWLRLQPSVDLTTVSLNEIATVDALAVVTTAAGVMWCDNADGTNTTTTLTDAYDGNPATSSVVTLTADDVVCVAAATPFDSVRFDVGATPNTIGASWTADYWNGTRWVSVAVATDGTAVEGKPLAQDGDIAFVRPAGWAQTAVDGYTGYWLRLRPSATLTPSVTIVEISSVRREASYTAPTDIMAFAPSGWTIDTTSYASFGDTTNGSPTVSNVVRISNFREHGPIVGTGIPLGATIDALDLAGNTLTLSVPATATAAFSLLQTNPVYLQFGGESCLEALIKVTDTNNEQFRLGTARQVVWLYRQQPSSGLVAIGDGDGATLDENPDVVLITKLTVSSDSHDLVTRIYPYGAGNADARLDISQSIRVAPAGYTVSTDGIGSYINNDVAEALYGRIERPQSFKDIAVLDSDANSPDPEPADQIAAANQLFDAAIAWLELHSLALTSYQLAITKLDVALEPGQTIDVQYRKTIDGYREVDVDTIRDGVPLVILEATTEIDEIGVRTVALQVATAARWPETDQSYVSGIASQASSMEAHTQPVNRARATRADSAAFADVAGTVQDANVAYLSGTLAFTGGITLSSSAWNGNHLVMGAYHFWVDASDRLRIKSGTPTGDTDGIVVGTQT